MHCAAVLYCTVCKKHISEIKQHLYIINIKGTEGFRFNWRNVNSSHFKQRPWLGCGLLTHWEPWSVSSDPSMPSVLLQPLSKHVCGMERCLEAHTEQLLRVKIMPLRCLS